MFSRTALLIGEESVKKLNTSRVAIFGVGGVGGYVLEALVRSGVGAFDLIDNDKVSVSNLNRQIIALHSTIGQLKTKVAETRAKDINPSVQIQTHETFVLPETIAQFDFSKYDYVVDAIDTVSGKIAIIESAKKAGVPVISAMGAGNKLCPEAFEISWLSKTSVCPLARVMRRELKARGVDDIKVAYSKEEPKKSSAVGDNGKPVPASIAFSPSVMGLLIASEVIKDLIKGFVTSLG